MSPFRITALALSAAFLFAGIIWPQAAEALFRLMLVALAVGFLAVRAYDVMLPATTTHKGYSPFDSHAAARTAPTSPRVLRELAGQLSAVDDERLGARSAIPWGVRASVVDEASRRLSEHHGLRLDDPRDHAAIRSLLTDPTWRLIDPADPEPRLERGPPGDRKPVPVTHLDLILDDLERL